MQRPTLLLLAVPALAVGVALGSASAALAATGGATAQASGANEVGKIGDPVATASAVLTFETATNQLCYTVTATSLEAVAMHIHKGLAGANGPVVVPLDPTKIGAGKTCTTVDATLLADIAEYPSSYYFNAHTKDYPEGALRGQLVASSSTTTAATPATTSPTTTSPTTTSPTTTTPATTSPTVTIPKAVAAGNGGQSQDSSSTLPMVLVLAGGAAVGTAGWRLARR